MEHGLFPSVETLRAPLGYLASLLSGGNREVVAAVLAKLIALRSYMRARNLGQPIDDGILKGAGLTEAAAARLYRLFTIGGYDERNVIPAQQREEQDPHARKGRAASGSFRRRGGGNESRGMLRRPCPSARLSRGAGRDAFGLRYRPQVLQAHHIESPLAPFARLLESSTLAGLQEEYVATFDFNPAVALYLGHHLFGTTGKRGPT